MVAVARALALEGTTVLSCDLPFRQHRPQGPPRGTAAEDREGLRNAVAALTRIAPNAPPGGVFLGGHSYGGRQASMLAASEPGLAGGLLLLSYPLHPPNRPSELRTAHFPRLRVPALFVSGSGDPFGSLEEIEEARKLIRAPTSLLAVEGAGHDLGFRRGNHDGAGELPGKIASTFLEFITSEAVQAWK